MSYGKALYELYLLFYINIIKSINTVQRPGVSICLAHVVLVILIVQLFEWGVRFGPHLFSGEQRFLTDAGHDDGVQVHLLPQVLIVRQLQVHALHPLKDRHRGRVTAWGLNAVTGRAQARDSPVCPRCSA